MTELTDGWLDQPLILLRLAVCLLSTSVTSVFVVLCICNFLLRFLLYLVLSRAWWNWPLRWLTNHWHCWLGHLARKIILEMTYNVLSGTLNLTKANSCFPLTMHILVSSNCISCFVCSPYQTLNLWRPRFSSHCCTDLEHSSAADHICSVTSRLLFKLCYL